MRVDPACHALLHQALQLLDKLRGATGRVDGDAPLRCAADATDRKQAEEQAAHVIVIVATRTVPEGCAQQRLHHAALWLRAHDLHATGVAQQPLH